MHIYVPNHGVQQVQGTRRSSRQSVIEACFKIFSSTFPPVAAINGAENSIKAPVGMKILRSEFPVVRVRLKKQSTYYDVDCRKVGWLGKKRLSFTDKNEALAKARQIGEQFNRTGLNGLNSQTVATTNREYAGWQKQLGEHGKTLSDAVHFYLEHLKQPVVIPVGSVSTLSERLARFKATDKKKQNRARSIGEIRIHAARVPVAWSCRISGSISGSGEGVRFSFMPHKYRPFEPNDGFSAGESIASDTVSPGRFHPSEPH